MPPPAWPQCGDHIPGQAAGTFSAQLVNYRVTTVNIVRGTCDLSASDAAVLARLPVNGRPYNRDLPSAHGEYRLTAQRSPDGDVLVTGLPLGEMQSTLHSVEIAEIAVFSIALLLTGVIGTGWVRLSLRPLRRVTATAAEVTRLPLGSGEVALPNRVPDADPRTEVGQLGVAFNRMLGHVESALARRHASEARLRTFAADASHELRTPLAAIRGYAELARRHPGALPDDVAHALSRVESESARMSGLVDDLLLLARLDAGRPLAGDPVDLTRLAIDAASDARAAAPDHRWQLELPGGVHHRPRRRAPAAPGTREPDEQCGPAHPVGDHRDDRTGHARQRGRSGQPGRPGCAERGRRRPGHSAGAAARVVRALRARRQFQVPRGRQHGPGAGDRRCGRRGSSRARPGNKPAGADGLRHHLAALRRRRPIARSVLTDRTVRAPGVGLQ